MSNMTDKDLTPLERRQSQEKDDDTVVDEIGENIPSSVIYIPDEGKFSNDASTLVDGSGEGSSKSMSRGKRAALNASLKQLTYNDNKIALDRSINYTIEIMHDLMKENGERPVFYPTKVDDDSNHLLNSKKAHLAMVRNNASIKSLEKTKIKETDEDPPEFKILKLDLKLGHNSHSSSNLVSTLDKKSIATLLEQKLSSQVRYLLSLKDRVDDTSSKVFVTGDLNAGKSSFCNTLLRRSILPVDQQPCTSVFCEVVDASRENGGIEEVHAVPIGVEYDKKDESTFEAHPLKELENLVYECDRYKILKVYVMDRRQIDESLLNNGVIDIKLIDAPGLNMDSYQTTQVFSRQEEIDLVVFVVNSENHFTLSAKEFISAAAKEKRYVFIVVNRFDNIKDKEKCKRRILEQVKSLSPDSYKNADEFVHFVSSKEASDDIGGSGGGDGDDDDGDPDGDKGNDDRDFVDPNFDELETSLRKFVLEKRSISKLLPAKDYLSNLLRDLEILSDVNEEMYSQEKEEKLAELNSKIAPRYQEILKKSTSSNDYINALVEDTCTEVYNSTKDEILSTLANFGDSPVVPYYGLRYLYEYAKDTQRVMINTVLSSVRNSEERAKLLTSEKVSEIIKCGKDSLGDEFLNNKVFKSELMFSRRKDTIIKSLDNPIQFADFFDPSIDSCLMWLGLPSDIISFPRNSLRNLDPVLVMTSIPKTVSEFRGTVSNKVFLTTLYSSGKLITTGAVIKRLVSGFHYVKVSTVKKVAIPVAIFATGFTVYYLLNDIPNAYPRKQARRIKSNIVELDYPHSNAHRISKECRQVLNYPARQVISNFQSSIDKRNYEKEKLEKSIKDAEISYGYFHELLNKINHQKHVLDEIDLEGLQTVE